MNKEAQFQCAIYHLIVKMSTILVMVCGLSVLAVAQQSGDAASNQAATPPQMNASPESLPASPCTALSAADPQMGSLTNLCAFALTFRHNLPDFACEQKTVSDNGQVTQALVTFVRGKEQYSNVITNGKPATANGGGDENGPGLLTTGEFGGDLVSLFTPPIVAEFKLRKETGLRSHSARIYEFHLPADKNRFWTIYGNNWNVRPELRGELWIELKTEKLRRLKIEPVHLSPRYNIATDDTTIDYAEVSLGDAGIFLLPKSSETSICTRDNEVSHLDKTVVCFHNVMKFHNCHKFTAKARILGDR